MKTINATFNSAASCETETFGISVFWLMVLFIIIIDDEDRAEEKRRKRKASLAPRPF